MFTLGDVSCDLERLSANRAKAEAALANPQVEKAEKKDDVDALFDDDDEATPNKAAPKAPPKDDVDALFDDEEEVTPQKAAPQAPPKDDVDALFDDEERQDRRQRPKAMMWMRSLAMMTVRRHPLISV